MLPLFLAYFTPAVPVASEARSDCLAVFQVFSRVSLVCKNDSL